AEHSYAVEQVMQESEAQWAALASTEPPAEAEIVARYTEAAAALERRAAEARAVEIERQRSEAEAERRREEAEAAERAQADAAAAEQIRKDVERRRLRLAELANDIEAAAGDEDLRSARRRATLVEREWRDLAATTVPTEDLAERYAAATAR